MNHSHMHKIGRFKIMITPRRKIKAEAAARQAEHIAFEKRKKIKAEAAVRQAEHIAFDIEAKSTTAAAAAAAAAAASKENISCNGESLLTSNLFGDFSPDENIDYIEKDKPSSYEKPSSLVEPLIYVIDMNVPIRIPLN
jgi:hypothetical protein